MNDELFDWVLPQGKPWDKKPEWIEGEHAESIDVKRKQKRASASVPGKSKKNTKSTKSSTSAVKPKKTPAAKPKKTPAAKPHSPAPAAKPPAAKPHPPATHSTPAAKPPSPAASHSSAGKPHPPATHSAPAAKPPSPAASHSSTVKPHPPATHSPAAVPHSAPATSAAVPFTPPGKPVPKPGKTLPTGLKPKPASSSSAGPKPTSSSAPAGSPKPPVAPGAQKPSAFASFKKFSKTGKEGKASSQKPEKEGKASSQKPEKEGKPSKSGKEGKTSAQKPEKEGKSSKSEKPAKGTKEARQRRNEKLDKANKESAAKPEDEEARKKAQKQAVKAQKEALEKKHQKDLSRMQARHQQELEQVRSQGGQVVQALQQQHQVEQQNLVQQHQQALNTVAANAQQPPTVIYVPGANMGIAPALAPANPIISDPTSALAYNATQNLITPNPVSIVASTTAPATLIAPLDQKRDLLNQIGWLPTSTIDEAASRLSVEDLKALYESKMRYSQALAANNNDRNNPSVVLFSQDYFNRIKALRASLGLDLDLIRVIEKSGVYGGDQDKVKTLANVLGGSKFSKYRSRILDAAGKDVNNPTNDKLMAAIAEARAKTRVGCHGPPSHEHLSLWQRFARPIRITSASYNLIDEFDHYDDLMAIAIRKAPNHVNINTIPGVPEIFNTLLNIYDVVSFLSPEGCNFPPALYHHLVVITKLRLLNAIREDPIYLSTLRNENAVFYNLLRDMKGEDVAEAWFSSHRQFASLLLEHLTNNAPREVGEHLIRCMSSSPSPADDVFTVYLTINPDLDPEHRINVRLRPDGPAVLAPQKPLSIKEQRNNTDLYRDSAELDHEQVIAFIDLLQHFYPKTAKPYHADRAALHKIRFTNGLIIAKENYPELDRDPQWQKLWKLFQSFISSFYFSPSN